MSLLSKNDPLNVQIKDALLILATVIFFNLSFPGGTCPWLAWVALIPLGIAIYNKSAWHAFRSTMTCALLCWIFAIWWIIPGICRATGSNFLAVFLFTLVFCLFYAVPYSVSAVIYTRFGWVNSITGAVKGALVWTSICCLVPHILPGNLAHSQYRYPGMIQIAEIGGVPFLFFCIHLTTFLGVTSIVRLKSNARYALTAAGLALLVPILIFGFGQWRMATLKSNADYKKDPLRVGMIQPNLGYLERSRKDWKKNIDKFDQLTRQLLSMTPFLDLIVWPEIPPPISYIQYPEDRQMLDTIFEPKKIPMMIAGIHKYTPENPGQPEEYYNVAEFIKDRSPPRVYQKQKRLPFGEYLPFRQSIPVLSKIFPGVLHYRAGKNTVLFDLDEDVRLIPLICYEAVFPSLVRQGIEKGGTVIINPVNDGWFGKGGAPEIHLALALFRAVEFRIPIIRATNSGRSAIIDISGEIIPESTGELFTPSVFSGQVSTFYTPTIFFRVGNLFLWLTLVLSIGSVLREWKRNEKPFS